MTSYLGATLLIYDMDNLFYSSLSRLLVLHKYYRKWTTCQMKYLVSGVHEPFHSQTVGVLWL